MAPPNIHDLTQEVIYKLLAPVATFLDLLATFLVHFLGFSEWGLPWGYKRSDYRPDEFCVYILSWIWVDPAKRACCFALLAVPCLVAFGLLWHSRRPCRGCKAVGSERDDLRSALYEARESEQTTYDVLVMPLAHALLETAAEFGDLEEKYANLEEQARSDARTAAKANHRAHNAEARLQAKDQDIATLKSKLETTDATAKAAEDQVDFLQRKRAADKQEISLQKDKAETLAADFKVFKQESVAEKSALLRQRKLLQKKLKCGRRAAKTQAVKVRKLRDKAKIATREYSELEQKLKDEQAARKSEAQKAKTAVAKEATEKQSLSQQLADEKKRAEKAEKDSLGKDAAIKAIEQQRDDNSSELMAESTKLAEATKHIGQLESEQKALQTELKTAESDLKQKVESARAEVRQHSENAAQAADAEHARILTQVKLDHAATLQSELDSAGKKATQDSEKAAKAADEKHAQRVAELQRDHESQLEEANARIQRVEFEAWSTRHQNTSVHGELWPLQVDRDYWKKEALRAKEQIEQLQLNHQSEHVTPQDRLETAESKDEALQSEIETSETEPEAVESASDEVEDRQQEAESALQTEDEAVSSFQEEQDVASEVAGVEHNGSVSSEKQDFASELEDVEHYGSVSSENAHINDLEPETPQDLDDEQDQGPKTADSTALDEELAKQEQADELDAAESDNVENEHDDVSDHDLDEDGSDDEEDGAPPPPPSGNCDNDAQNDDSGYGDQAEPDAPKWRKRRTRARGHKHLPEWNERQAELFRQRETNRVAVQEAESAAQIQARHTPQAQRSGLQSSRWAPATPGHAPRQQLGQRFQAPSGARGERGPGGRGRGRGGNGGGRW